MQVKQLSQCRNFAFSGLRVGVRTIIELATDRNGTAIMAYAFLAALIAVAATVSFEATGAAVASMYDVIATAFIASMPQLP